REQFLGVSTGAHVLQSELDAEGARVFAPCARVALALYLDAPFLLTVLEGRMHLGDTRVVLDLLVEIVGRAEPEADLVHERSARRELALEVELRLFEVDARVVVGVLARHMIEAVDVRERQADEAAVEEIRAAERAAMRARGRVLLLAAG